MDDDDQQADATERRSEKRDFVQPYYSVQFTTAGLGAFYQFKIWNISNKGMCILVKTDSIVLKHVKVGDILEMTYYLSNARGINEQMKTQIKHITPNPDGRFAGHSFIGLAIL